MRERKVVDERRKLRWRKFDDSPSLFLFLLYPSPYLPALALDQRRAAHEEVRELPSRRAPERGDDGVRGDVVNRWRRVQGFFRFIAAVKRGRAFVIVSWLRRGEEDDVTEDQHEEQHEQQQRSSSGAAAATRAHRVELALSTRATSISDARELSRFAARSLASHKNEEKKKFKTPTHSCSSFLSRSLSAFQTSTPDNPSTMKATVASALSKSQARPCPWRSSTRATTNPGGGRVSTTSSSSTSPTLRSFHGRCAPRGPAPAFASPDPYDDTSLFHVVVEAVNQGHGVCDSQLLLRKVGCNETMLVLLGE